MVYLIIFSLLRLATDSNHKLRRESQWPKGHGACRGTEVRRLRYSAIVVIVFATLAVFFLCSQPFQQ
jgi:hypothetical protein